MVKIRLELISDLYRNGYDLRVACCSCDHAAVLDALELSQECQR